MKWSFAKLEFLSKPPKLRDESSRLEKSSCAKF